MLSETETGLIHMNFVTGNTTSTISGLGVYTNFGAFMVNSSDISKILMVGCYTTPSETEDYTVTKGALHLFELVSGTYVHTKSFEDLDTGVARYGEGYGNWAVLSNNGSKILLAHEDSYMLSEGTRYYGVLSL